MDDVLINVKVLLTLCSTIAIVILFQMLKIFINIVYFYDLLLFKHLESENGHRCMLE